MSADVGVILGSLLDSNSAHVSEIHADDHIFSSYFVAEHGLVLDGGGALVFEDGLFVAGDLVLSNFSSVTFKGNVEVSGNVIIDAGTSIVFDNLFTAGGAVTLSSDEIDFLGGAGSAGIAGNLALKSHTAGLDVRVGFTADTLGSLGLTDSDLAAFHAGGKVTIGAAGFAGGIVIDSADFQNDVAITGADITVQQSLVA